jgi:hypothetical protein
MKVSMNIEDKELIQVRKVIFDASGNVIGLNEQLNIFLFG